MAIDKTITPVLKELDVTVARTLGDDAPYEYMVDHLEPFVMHAFEVERLSNVEEVVDERDPKHGEIVVYVELEDAVYAGGVGTYNDIGNAAFTPVEDHFS